MPANSYFKWTTNLLDLAGKNPTELIT